MVDLNKFKGSLNHIYKFGCPSLVIPIGQQVSINHGDLVLFEKSIALASDLKRLPILVGMNIVWRVDGNWVNYMNASALGSIQGILGLYNKDAEPEGEENEDEDLICEWQICVSQDTGVPVFIESEPMSWEMQGGILLFDTISLQCAVIGNQNVAGANLPNNILEGFIFLEVDWVKVSAQELSDFIAEYVYAQQ